MQKTLLAAAAVFAFATAPTLAQDTECPPGTTKSSPDAGAVSCEADTSSSGPAPTNPGGNQAGDSPLGSTQAGQGVRDTATNPDGGVSNNN
jgi:hypothetical protein